MRLPSRPLATGATVMLLLLAPVACNSGDSDPPGEDPPIGDPPGEDPPGIPECCGIDAVETLSPAEGWSVHIPPFEVPAGTEITDCYFLAIPDLNNGGD